MGQTIGFFKTLETNDTNNIPWETFGVASGMTKHIKK
eukprot:COSAG01_NODE_25573_length_739_cov_2.917317_1_plen_37_part_00